MPSVFLEWQRENSGGLQQENRHFKLNLVSLPSQYPVHWVVQEAHDLMTASCPSWTNRARHTRRFAAAALWPRAKRIDFPLNGMRADERKTERTRERAGGRGTRRDGSKSWPRKCERESLSAIWGELWLREQERVRAHGTRCDGGRCQRRREGVRQ